MKKDSLIGGARFVGTASESVVENLLKRSDTTLSFVGTMFGAGF